MKLRNGKEISYNSRAGGNIEFGNFLEIYYKDMDVRLRENTMYTKRYIIDLKIKPYFEKKILSEITVADVRAWQNELLTYKDKNGKGHSPTYLKTVNCQLTAIFNYAMRYYNLQEGRSDRQEQRRTEGFLDAGRVQCFSGDSK